MHGRWLLLAVAALGLFPRNANASVLHVPADYPTIAAAVGAAAVADTVEIACGTYFEHGIQRVGSAITILSESGDPDCVTIDASGSASILSLAMQNGASITGITFRGATAGAVSLLRSSNFVDDCVFRDNGGGLGCEDGYVTDCVFSGNGIYDALYLTGGVSRCLFEHNQTAVTAGPGYTTVSHCTFHDNSYFSLWADGQRDAIARVSFQWCTVYHEWGLFADQWSQVVVEHCILDHGQKAFTCWENSEYIVACTDSHGNTAPNWPPCVAQYEHTNGNLSVPPMFCDPDHGDFTLNADSPCAPPHAGDCWYMGAEEVGCGAVGVEPHSWGRLKASFRNESLR